MVHPGGAGQDLHSDDWGWRGGSERPGTFATSIFVDDALENCAPLRIAPQSAVAELPVWEHDILEALAGKVLAPRGSVLIRDVNVWHSGTANETDQTRYMPGFRVFTSARTEDFKWRPRRSVVALDFDNFFPDSELQECFATSGASQQKPKLSASCVGSFAGMRCVFAVLRSDGLGVPLRAPARRPA